MLKRIIKVLDFSKFSSCYSKHLKAAQELQCLFKMGIQVYNFNIKYSEILRLLKHKRFKASGWGLR